MKKISSAEFRKTYAKLEEPTVVTANSHEIGVWVPSRQGTTIEFAHDLALREPGQTFDLKEFGLSKRTVKVTTAQAHRDEILRRINRSG